MSYQTELDALYTLYQQATAQLIAVNTDLAALNAGDINSMKKSYSVSGPEGNQSVDWNGVRNALNNEATQLMNQLMQLNKLIQQMRPVQFLSVGRV